MRNAINGAWLYGVVLVFMMVFISYISITFNYSRVYQMKSVLITKIEQNQGVNENSLNGMGAVIGSYGYTATGNCKGNYLGVRYKKPSEHVISKQCGDTTYNNSSICLKRVEMSSTHTKKYYYRVGAFFGFSLPIVGQIYSFYVEGESNEIYYPSDISNITAPACL